MSDGMPYEILQQKFTETQNRHFYMLTLYVIISRMLLGF